MNSAHTLLSIKNMEIDYPSREGHGRVTAVKNLNLDLAQGEIAHIFEDLQSASEKQVREACRVPCPKGDANSHPLRPL